MPSSIGGQLNKLVESEFSPAEYAAFAAPISAVVYTVQHSEGVSLTGIEANCHFGEAPPALTTLAVYLVDGVALPNDQTGLDGIFNTSYGNIVYNSIFRIGESVVNNELQIHRDWSYPIQLRYGHQYSLLALLRSADQSSLTIPVSLSITGFGFVNGQDGVAQLKLR